MQITKDVMVSGIDINDTGEVGQEAEMESSMEKY